MVKEEIRENIKRMRPAEKKLGSICDVVSWSSVTASSQRNRASLARGLRHVAGRVHKTRDLSTAMVLQEQQRVNITDFYLYFYFDIQRYRLRWQLTTMR